MRDETFLVAGRESHSSDDEPPPNDWEDEVTPPRSAPPPAQRPASPPPADRSREPQRPASPPPADRSREPQRPASPPFADRSREPQRPASPPFADRSGEPQRPASAPSSRAPSEPPARPRSASLPLADPSGPPRAAESEGPPRAADAGLRAQAQAWTPAQKLEYLRTRNVGDCTRCKLAKTRTNIVFGVGDPNARVMFVGEAPGADEDRRGEPFVGAAGRRLTQWIERLGMKREQVYIANVLKCRPPGNREPAAEEIERCSPFLRAQVRAIRPDVIVALGRYAGMLLLGADQDLKLAQMRNRRFTYDDAGAGLQIPLHVTYHPSYVIRREGELPPGQRNPADDTVMSDLERALRVLRS
ncbi:uracil-DNA glycosylase [Nannocystis bainbridge]|uniref:Type-4 uracil-DNA glycosylase n=1 Tax=Nannocystis bainbridge TaxID=2995303 RepID=A0ABT5DSG5_9BACT|nr:uracil-DNA glycosylase family protein [Nannocystis bainbridge]MDC0715321.1 uracil-DNA glycosylase family protein [Nannocystis bainbridge]